MQRWPMLWLSALIGAPVAAQEARPAFPAERPERTAFPHPFEGERLDISPPGFSWWRAAPTGEVRYRLAVKDAAGEVAYVSPLIDDPAHVPDRALPAGDYTWTVDAVADGDAVVDTTAPRTFTILPNAMEQPWPDIDALLAKVPRDHPRLLFPAAELDEIRATLATTRAEAYAALKRAADAKLEMEPPAEPDYDQLEDPAERRLAYTASFAELRNYHQSGMLPLALMYALSGERKYGEVARRTLLAAAEWDPEGISSVMAPYGDEVGLGLAKSGPETYDWIHDLLTPAEREKVEAMLLARGNQMLRLLRRQDYLAKPENSHSGRLPGYLIEHALMLPDRPEAREWLEYALRVLMTVYPHWGGPDGGWAEGMAYGNAYNTIYLMPFEALERSTGFDLWQRPFYRKVRWFFVYNLSPLGEVMPWGDTEDAPVPPRSGGIRALLQHHALRYRDPLVRGWVNLLENREGEDAGISYLPGLLLPDDLAPGDPAELPPDRAFFDVGWAAFHSDIAAPERDLLVLFKSSPYGGVSHSHADQNSFAILKGGVALAIPAGSRYPQHGTPFHTRYTQTSRAHNTILVNGEGQVNRDGNRGGRLAAFESHPHLGYVAGDASLCYDGLERFTRHLLVVRPGLIITVDDLAAPEPSTFQWLLHAKDRTALDEGAQAITVERGGATLTARLFTPGGMALSQTDEWGMDPKEGFPTATKRVPDKQWHVTAESRERTAQRRIAAVMTVDHDVEVSRDGDILTVVSRQADGAATVRIDLGDGPALTAEFAGADGAREEVRAP